MSLQVQISELLKNTKDSLTARQISEQLSVQDKTQVNKILYTLLKTKEVNISADTPPQWSISGFGPHADEKVPDTFHMDVPVVLVDLGNVHDTLQELEPYARKGLVKAFAFADLAFNGYGVRPECDPCIPLYQSTTPDKNAADIEMVWKCAEVALLQCPPDHRLTFYIVTKDQGFRTLEVILRRFGHTVEFVRGWDDLKVYIA